jgi:hypothetical protein
MKNKSMHSRIKNMVSFPSHRIMGLKVSCHIAECAKDLETKFSIMPFSKIKSNEKAFRD